MSGLNKHDITRMAREAGLPVSDKFDGIGYVWCSDEYPIDEQLQRFAVLVAAAEREACAVIAFNAKTYLEAAAAIRARGNDAA